MILTNSHNPDHNAGLIHNYFKQEPRLDQMMSETNQLFIRQAVTWKPAVSMSRLSRLFSFFAGKQAEPLRIHDVIVDGTSAYPDWKPLLDHEYAKLEKVAATVVHVNAGDDIREAALGGNKTILLGEGVFHVNEIELDSNTILRGAGKSKTILKLKQTAPKRSFVVTNRHHVKGNHHISVENLTMDWSIERLHPSEKSSSGNNRSSCLTFAHVTYGWVKNCAAINPGLHGFDVSSTLYDYSGDGRRAWGGSRFIWIDCCTGSGFGDDGVTTHHSDCILISNSFMHNPSGRSHKAGFSNSNGFEVDDGSRSVWLVNNASARCFGGVEIKAHATSSAAANVHIIGHLSEEDNRSYNFRHIGHHKKTDPDSKTAYWITATRIVSIKPKRTDLYVNSKPRVLTVSAYRNVVINGLYAEADPEYTYRALPVAGIQYKAAGVHLQRIRMKHFHTASHAIQVFGGDNRASAVTIQDAVFDGCGAEPVAQAAGTENHSPA